MAPVDGKIFRVVARQNGELLKAGDQIAILVPATTKDVVELWMDGNDVPLISEGRPVRIQFEGWPALQFSGWPSIAVGTFGGIVQLVDSTDNGAGKFRVLIAPDPKDEAWPTKNYLRQGVRANGWVLLNQVPLGFELWRQFNGFPPVVSRNEPGTGKEAGKDASKDKK
jgi:membrane fusion protein, adhesin transport system